MAQSFGRWESDPIPFRESDDLRIVVPARGELVGKLLVDDGVPLNRVRLMVRADAGGDVPPLQQMGWLLPRVEPDGTFRFSELAEGRYLLVAAASHDGGVLATIRDLYVDAAGAGTDARVQPLDLRGRLRWIRLDVFDEQGGPVKATLFALGAGGDFRQLGVSDRHHLFESDYELSTLLVVEEGYPVVSTGPLDDGVHRVTLERGVDVTVTWGSEASPPPAPYRVVATLTPAAPAAVPGGARAASYVTRFGPREAELDGDAFRLAVERPGTYRLKVVVELNRRGYVDVEELTDPDARPLIEVVAATKTGFMPSPDVVQRALEALPKP